MAKTECMIKTENDSNHFAFHVSSNLRDAEGGVPYSKIKIIKLNLRAGKPRPYACIQ